MFALNVDNTAAQTKVLDLELRVNGTGVKTISFDISKTSEELVTRMTAVVLPASSYLTFAVREAGGGTDLELKATTVAYLLKLTK